MAGRRHRATGVSVSSRNRLRSSPGAMAGRRDPAGGQAHQPLDVAILARRDGRAQDTSVPFGWPSTRGSCDPRPARWPGAGVRRTAGHGAESAVAILARRDGRAQVARAPAHQPTHPLVAILARRDGRAQGGRPGLVPVLRVVVAILARRDGRAQAGGTVGSMRDDTGLRSSPGAMAGRRAPSITATGMPFSRLRSSPGAMAGRRLRPPRTSFHPRLLLRSSPGAMAGRRARDRARLPSRGMLRSSPGAMAGRRWRNGRAQGVTPRQLRSSPGAMAGRRVAEWWADTQDPHELRSSPGAMAGRRVVAPPVPRRDGGVVAILARRDGRAQAHYEVVPS
ncbi:hypothetical protein SAMN05444365_1083 [Micromonospora pattaloongensis]|uniref:Uncharacterized protein n=1 Tax=Micromonospora pattaloongensis TaxID=405436 RepID=A0A1H3REA0_9ACTN|nr:hypothetical protein SAMN05444365_1083 [Micromonospora pattaloongensis]